MSKSEVSAAPSRPGLVDLDSIDLSCLNDKELIECDEYLYSPRAHPLFRVLNTLLLVAEIYSFR